MTKRYLGNIITQNPTAPAGPYEDSAASGVWSLAEAFAYSKAGLWPTAGRSQTAIYSGGGSPSATNIIQSFNLATTGNASDYGDLLGSLTAHTSFASSSRAVFAGGTNGADRIEYVTISSSGIKTLFNTLQLPQQETPPTSGILTLQETNSLLRPARHAGYFLVGRVLEIKKQYNM